MNRLAYINRWIRYPEPLRVCWMAPDGRPCELALPEHRMRYARALAANLAPACVMRNGKVIARFDGVRKRRKRNRLGL